MKVIPFYSLQSGIWHLDQFILQNIKIKLAQRNIQIVMFIHLSVAVNEFYFYYQPFRSARQFTTIVIHMLCALFQLIPNSISIPFQNYFVVLMKTKHPYRSINEIGLAMPLKMIQALTRKQRHRRCT